MHRGSREISEGVGRSQAKRGIEFFPWGCPVNRLCDCKAINAPGRVTLAKKLWPISRRVTRSDIPYVSFASANANPSPLKRVRDGSFGSNAEFLADYGTGVRHHQRLSWEN